MRTLGVDLASQPKKTAACIIEWGTNSVEVSDPVLRVTNRCIVDLAKGCAIGIDSPFGWPLPFIEFLNQAHAPNRGSIPLDLNDPLVLRRLCFRRTDIRVRDEFGGRPFSVSSDKIALCAMRCVHLLDQLDVTDRTGNGRVFEVYPAVALKVWGFDSTGYKSRKGDPPLGAQVRAKLLQSIQIECPWLRCSPAAMSMCIRNDDAFDAVIASLVTRAAYLDLTERPTTEDAEIAKLEGWIAVPSPDSLGRLHESRTTSVSALN